MAGITPRRSRRDNRPPERYQGGQSARHRSHSQQTGPSQVAAAVRHFSSQRDAAAGLGQEVRATPRPVQQVVQGPVQQAGLGVQVPGQAAEGQPLPAQHGGIGIEEEYVDIQDRVNPLVPGPQPLVRQDEDGWDEIDQLGAWDCALSPFQAISEVPAQHREAWAMAMDKVLRKIWDNQEESEELDRAIKWWFFLPQALCRRAQRGGRAGVGQIKQRFNCIVRGDYGAVVKLWLDDMKVRGEKDRRREGGGKPSKEDEKKTRQAVSFISRGWISKAVNRMTSNGVASLENRRVKASMEAKYPDRGKEMPARVSKGQCVDTMRTLREPLLALKRGVAPGTGQLRPEFLITLAEVWEEGCSTWDMLDNFAMRHVGGTLPAWYYKVCMTVETVPLFKTAGQDPSLLRPIGMRNPFIKTIHREVIKQNKGEFVSFLEPCQLGMSVAGGAKLVHVVRMLLEEKREFVCVKLDFRNAFNEVYRARVVEALEEELTLRHLAHHAATVLAPGSGLESKGVLWGESVEGVTQGDPESGPYFCVAIHKYVMEADNVLASQGGCARFGWDDGYLVGPPVSVFQVLERFAAQAEEKCGLFLQKTKTEVFTWDGSLPPGTTPGLVRAGAVVSGQWEPGLICYGVPIGTDTYVHTKLEEKVSEVAREVGTVAKVLQDERQAMWSVLCSSTSQKLDYWLSLVYPSQVRPAAEGMDKLMLESVESLLGVHIPLSDEGLGWECPIQVPVQGLEGRSFQQWVMRQPVKMGGLGLRSQVELSPAAFIGGLEQSLPHFSDSICPQLTEVVGDGDGQENLRWQTLLRSGCRTGRELEQSWHVLQREAQQCAQYLGQELESHLAVEVEGAGQGSVDGSTRKKITQQREELRGAVLKEALVRHTNVTLRPVLAWANRDKLSSSWLQCLPGPEGLTKQAFTEALSSLLCMPSPACRDRVGASVGKKTVDIFGDSVMSEVLPGDHWRIRHDKMKMKIHSLCIWARLPVTVEVWSLFAHLIPQQALNRMERGRKRQAIVPDFRIEMPCATGGTMAQLAELKMISRCESWYTPGSGVRGTDKRANGLPASYRRKARKVDQEVLEIDREERGPVERRLEEFGDLLGLCFGAWGEASEGVHKLVQTLAEARLKFQGLQLGRPGSEAELGMLVGQVRKELSMVAVKGKVECLLSKLHQVGPGNQQLAKRRVWAISEDKRMAKERAAQWARRVDGVQTLRKGFIKTA